MDDDVIRIPLRARDGSVRAWAIVDREDADLADVTWHQNGNGYAQRRRGDPYGLMHRIVLGRLIGRELATAEQCDHINGDRLDDRRDNLRIATNSQNARNRKPIGESAYMGVSRNGGAWRAKILPAGAVNRGAQIHLGIFADEEEAARAYDRAAREYHGEFARLNFPDGDA